MLGDKKKSARRLSSLFSSASSEASGSTNNQKLSPTPASSESSSRLTKVRNRLSSATHLTPEYPPPPAQSPRHVSLSNPTIQPVEPADLEPLEPPPPLEVPSRASSPASSRPGTPSLDPGSEGKLKKLRRKSGLFGGPPGGIEGVDGAPGTPQGNASPLAWIVGHKGKVPYNLTFLLNGEKVACCGSQNKVPTADDIKGTRTLGRRRRHVCLPLPPHL
jgi:hypothetical protein